MQADHRRRRPELAKLQRLRMASAEIALGEAREKLREAQDEAQAARDRLYAREVELHRLLASDGFAPDRLLLQAALLCADTAAADAADNEMAEAAMAEAVRKGSWQASRRQHEQLRSSHRAAERRFARKAEARALAELPSLHDAAKAQS